MNLPSKTARRIAQTCALAAAALGTISVHAYQVGDVQLHGFASQAYILSDGNNIYGDSQRGSTEFSELGINANWQANNRLNLVGQLISRDAGATDNGSVKIDYLFADYKAIESDETGLGFRFGRVRNAFGLYNETRDVLFTRPSIFMPQAVYFEGNGLRELLFSSDGAQLYSYWDSNDQNTYLSITMGRDKSIPRDVVKNILGSGSGSGFASAVHHAKQINPVYSQLGTNLNGGRTRLALSTLTIGLEFEVNSPFITGELSLDADGFVLSAQHNLQHWSFTSEYSQMDVQFTGLGSSSPEQGIESVYAQAQYRFHPDISAHSRVEYVTYDRDNRNENDSSQLVMGLRWSPAPRWLIAGDIAGIRGTAGIPGVDNPQGTRERTEVLAIMIGYRF